tara:strand:+ start:6595 stop:7170 length:576 start_codon:yes stop_codon:yes gene_type:complete
MKRNKETIDLVKKVYSKTEYPKIIDTKFNELGVTSITSQLQNTLTVEQFFLDYTSLFYEIPAFGDINSHQYLIETSAEYIDYEFNNEELEALRAEITQLRKDLLQAQIDKVEALTGQTINLNIDSIDDNEFSTENFGNLINNIDQSIPSSPTEENTTAETVVSNTAGNPNTSAAGINSSSTGGSSGGGGGY